MKRCATCGEWKTEDSFNWRYKALGIRHPTCRDCHKEYRRSWYEDHKETHLQNVQERKVSARQDARQYVLDYLSTHPCSACGESDPAVLDFHHLGGKDKEISVLISGGYSLAKIQEEIDKCAVLCANCHRRKTAKEQGWFRGL
jgi:hypothetical protein